MKIRKITGFLMAVFIATTGIPVDVSAKNLEDQKYDYVFIATEIGRDEIGGYIKLRLNDWDMNAKNIISMYGYEVKDAVPEAGVDKIIFSGSAKNIEKGEEIIIRNGYGVASLLESGWVQLRIAVGYGEGEMWWLLLDVRGCGDANEIGMTCMLGDEKNGIFRYGDYVDGEEEEDEEVGDIEVMIIDVEGQPQDVTEEVVVAESFDEGEEEDSEEGGRVVSAQGGNIMATVAVADDNGVDNADEDEADVERVQNEDDSVSPPVGGEVEGVKVSWTWLFWLSAIICVVWLMVAVFRGRKKGKEKNVTVAKRKK